MYVGPFKYSKPLDKNFSAASGHAKKHFTAPRPWDKYPLRAIVERRSRVSFCSLAADKI